MFGWIARKTWSAAKAAIYIAAMTIILIRINTFGLSVADIAAPIWPWVVIIIAWRQYLNNLEEV